MAQKRHTSFSLFSTMYITETYKIMLNANGKGPSLI